MKQKQYSPLSLFSCNGFSSPPAGLKVTSGDALSGQGSVTGGVSVEVGVSDGAEGSVLLLQRETARLQEQLRSSEELNETLRSELDLTRSVLKHSPQKHMTDKPTEQQNTSDSKNINSGRAQLSFTDSDA